MTSDKQTTPTINGLRLISPEEAGYYSTLSNGEKANTILLRGDKPYFCFNDKTFWGPALLIPLPKPRTTRPFKRGEVKCGDVFRSKDSKRDYMTCAVDDTHISLHQAGSVTYKYLYDNFDRLTYDSEGREVLSVAGIEE